MEPQPYERASDQFQQPFTAPMPGGKHLVGHSDWRRELRRTILSRVVPRLSEIRHEAAAASDVPVAPRVTEDQVVRFSDLVLAAAVPSLILFIGDLRAEGIGMEAILLDLLTPAARRLGDLWLLDRLSFLDVTAALGRLQGVMRALGPDFDGDTPGLIHGKKILLAPVVGEQHIFGLSVVAAFFRRAGWNVTFEPRMVMEDLLALIRAERFTTIGLSIATERGLECAPAQFEAIRRASLARNVTLLAGGPVFLVHPDLDRTFGVDAVARDATEAVQMAEALSGQAASHHPSP